MSDREDQKLAKQFHKTLQGNPEATVQELSAEHDVDVDTVVRILDSHVVGEDGKIEHAGEGQGGGWVPQPETPS